MKRLSHQDTLSDQNIALGWTKYYIGSCDGSIGNYDCLDRVFIKNDGVEFYFNKKGFDAFEIDIIKINLSKTNLEKIQGLLIERFNLEENVTIETEERY